MVSIVWIQSMGLRAIIVITSYLFTTGLYSTPSLSRVTCVLQTRATLPIKSEPLR